MVEVRVLTMTGSGRLNIPLSFEKEIQEIKRQNKIAILLCVIATFPVVFCVVKLFWSSVHNSFIGSNTKSFYSNYIENIIS